MNRFRIQIDIEAIDDLQQATDWYNQELPGLGKRFLQAAKLKIATLKKTPLNYSIRYDHVRCALVGKFPFLIHFTVDEKSKLVEVHAVLHTSRNPKIWKKRIKN